MSDNDRRSLAKEEYFYLQGAYERFDSAFFQIKGWSVTLGTAGLLAALNLKANQSLAFLVIGGMSLAFWSMDITWKTFQRAHLPRIEALEAILRSDEPITEVPEVRASWKSNFDAMRGKNPDNDFPGPAKFAPNVMIPPAIILVAAVALAYLSWAGWLSSDKPESPANVISISRD